MRYTVKQLAKLSGVSARTLRFYDEIGLLKPAYYAENGYRYYQEEQLLMLQQILFFRNLGIKLSDIQQIVLSDKFDKLQALQMHKNQLQQNVEHTKTLIATLDKTIAYVKGEITLEDKQMYTGFQNTKHIEMGAYLANPSEKPGDEDPHCAAKE